MLVSNTSTLVLLAKVGCLEEFIEIAPTIEIPIQVKREALFEKGSYYSILIQKLIQDKKIKIVNVDKVDVIKVMSQFNLDEGEAATFIMFKEKRHNAILTDDGELIKLCKLEKIPFASAMAVVIRMFETKKLSKEKTMELLENLHNIGRYSEKLYEYFKREVK